MTGFLNISLCQTNIIWQDINANIRHLDELLGLVPGDTHLIILPEMFLTGFSMDVSLIAQKMDGKGVQWLSSTATVKKIAMMGSLVIEENGNFYNRLLVALPDGRIQHYDKRHLFRMGEEHKHFTAGKQLLVTDINGWNIMPLVCYDLRFPVWSRNINLRYDILVYVANWPQSRRDPFLSLLKARAIENQCYVVAVNRVGTDGEGISYVGDSVVIDPKGIFLNVLSANEQIINCPLSLPELKKFRQKFPAYLDADDFEVRDNTKH
jgi:omega-amidase